MSIDAFYKAQIKDASDKTLIEEIHSAVFWRETEKLRILLALRPDLVNARDEYQHTPLLRMSCCVRPRSNEIAMLLLDAGADVNAKDEYHYTCLHKLAMTTSVEADIQTEAAKQVRSLVLHGADVDAQTEHGITPLMATLHYNNTPVIYELILAGANPRSRTRYYNKSLYEEAVASGKEDIINIIYKAEYDLKMRGNEPLNYMALAGGKPNCAENLPSKPERRGARWTLQKR